METPSKLIKYHQLARPENRASLTSRSPRLAGRLSTTPLVEVYIKLTVIDDLVIVTFKEL